MRGFEGVLPKAKAAGLGWHCKTFCGCLHQKTMVILNPTAALQGRLLVGADEVPIPKVGGTFIFGLAIDPDFGHVNCILAMKKAETLLRSAKNSSLFIVG